MWYRDDQELKADQHVMFKNTLTTMSLGLMKAKREHSGRYVVVVENSTGSRKGVCNITVVGMDQATYSLYVLYIIYSRYGPSYL
jgi:hypothetical protein